MLSKEYPLKRIKKEVEFITSILEIQEHGVADIRKFLAKISEKDRSDLRALVSGIEKAGAETESYLENVRMILLKYYSPGTKAMKVLPPLFLCALWCKQNSRYGKTKDPIETIRGKWGLSKNDAKILRRTLEPIGIGISKPPVSQSNNVTIEAADIDIAVCTGLK
jgi:hypothetical protein